MLMQMKHLTCLIKKTAGVCFMKSRNKDTKANSPKEIGMGHLYL